MNLRRNSLLLALLLAAMPTLAARDDLHQQIVVDAKRQSIDIDKGLVQFEEGVIVRQGSLEIRANLLRVEQKHGKGKEVLIATGNPVKLRQTLDDGRPLEASAREVRYELDSRTVTLNGGAMLKQQDSEVHGEIMRYNLAEGRLQAESGGEDANSRVTAIFAPQQLQQLRDESSSDTDATSAQDTTQP